MFTVLEIIKRTTDFFAAKDVDSPRLNAELLIGHALQLKRMQLYLQFERPLTEPELEKIRPLVRRRAQHEPVQYILGETEFNGIKLKVDRRALIPRPETELLVENAVGACSAAPARVLDLGTGSGAIAIALSRAFPTTQVLAIDNDEAALSLARENVANNGLDARVTLLTSNWFNAIAAGARFQLIVTNPPYLSADEAARAASEVRDFEPAGALVSADDGLADLRAIIAAAPAFLTPDGILAMETGIGHHEALLPCAKDAGFARAESRQDLTGRDRFVLAWMTATQPPVEATAVSGG
jgi:release factor glutamine methyltransferase